MPALESLGNARTVMAENSSFKQREQDMAGGRTRFVGVELYFDDLEGAKTFYRDLLGLALTEEEPDAHARFDSDNGFLCLERKGLDTYPSQEKAVVFLEVSDLGRAIETVGANRILQSELDPTQRQPYAILHDPGGYNVVLIQSGESNQVRQGRT